MVSVFWDAKGILFINYLEKGKSIAGEYYASLLDRLKAAFLPGQKFVFIEEAIQTSNDYFEGLKENHFREGIEKLSYLSNYPRTIKIVLV